VYSPIPNDYFMDHVVGRQLKVALMPRHCHITNRLLWLEYAYCITAMYTGPGEPIFEYRWYDKNEYLIARLKDLI
jgi:hypothetical protein